MIMGYMKENLEIIYEMEKEYIIIMMVIDMKETIKMIKEKEKEYFIIVMVIERWVII